MNARVGLEVLHVPDCPNLPVMLDNLRAATGLPIVTREITTDTQAAARDPACARQTDRGGLPVLHRSDPAPGPHRRPDRRLRDVRRDRRSGHRRDARPGHPHRLDRPDRREHLDPSPPHNPGQILTQTDAQALAVRLFGPLLADA